MTLSLYIQCAAMFILGQALHLFLIKIPAVKARTRAANKTYLFKEWWNCDWNIILATAVIGCMAILGLDQLLNWKPAILEYVKWFFAGIGAFGSTIAMSKFSQYEKEITKILDFKANISDNVTGGTTTSKQTAERGAEVLGVDVTKPTGDH